MRLALGEIVEQNTHLWKYVVVQPGHRFHDALDQGNATG